MGMEKSVKTALALCLCLGIATSSRADDFGQWAQSVQIHGYASQGFLYSTEHDYLSAHTSDGTFEFNEASLNFTSQLSDRLRVGAQLLTRDLGHVGNNEVTLDWACFDYRLSDLLGVRAGRFRIPAGLHSETWDLDAVRPMILLPLAYDESLRDVQTSSNGAVAYGLLPLGPAGDIDYQVFIGGSSMSSDGSLAQMLEGMLPGIKVTHLDNGWLFGGKASWLTPLEGLALSASLMNSQKLYGEFEAGEGMPVPSGVAITTKIPAILGWFFSGDYRTGPLTLQSEFYRNSSHGKVYIGPEFAVPLISSGMSWYALASWRWTDWLETAVRYGEYYENIHDRDGSDADEPNFLLGGATAPRHTRWQKEHVLSLRFDATESWSFKLEGHYMDGTAKIPAEQFLEKTAAGDPFDKHWTLVAAKTTVTF